MTWPKALVALILNSCFLFCIRTETFDFSHTRLTQVLGTSVKNGVVDYSALKSAPTELTHYLDTLDSVSETEFQTWPKEDRLAFLINLYNGSVLRLIVDHYPVASIRDIGGIFGSPWKQKCVRAWGKLLTLETLEHQIIRPKYAESRIHFALVCAAKSCPQIRSEAYVGKQLDEQLDHQGKVFLADRNKNWIERDSFTLHLSPIFKWYSSDFRAPGVTLINAITPFISPEEAGWLKQNSKEWSLRYMRYDWRLNGK
ncbi:MAG: DUF547 domain-containing protein [Pedosphaera sp.]|nr:DUF547 domain-containing protein [Pedosphaera sp.]